MADRRASAMSAGFSTRLLFTPREAARPVKSMGGLKSIPMIVSFATEAPPKAISRSLRMV